RRRTRQCDCRSLAGNRVTAPPGANPPQARHIKRTTNLSELAMQINEIANSISTFKDSFGTRLSELERRATRERDPGDYVAANDDNPLAAALLDSKEIKDLTSTFRGRAVVKLQGERADITSGNTTVGAG